MLCKYKAVCEEEAFEPMTRARTFLQRYGELVDTDMVPRRGKSESQIIGRFSMKEEGAFERIRTLYAQRFKAILVDHVSPFYQQ